METVSTRAIEAFHVAGLKIRTDNAREATSDGLIGGLWQRLLQENARLDRDIFAVYHNYESDQNGSYSYLLGYKVASTEAIPEGYSTVEIRAGNYGVFISDRGPAWETVPAAWKRIWASSPERLKGARAFQTDYEIHSSEDEAPVQIFVGVRIS